MIIGLFSPYLDTTPREYQRHERKCEVKMQTRWVMTPADAKPGMHEIFIGKSARDR